MPGPHSAVYVLSVKGKAPTEHLSAPREKRAGP